ncbi:hypothetical protein M8Z33_39960 [Streptomyces sp. ZAF1911]|uniref:hypothetical protein n=1 Tax=Streptomyces sp. ZAF1911 TaxID=2944129 RepID=UPI00237C2DF4|nr:hypothetical protein [Streptomyces sp. ZAF1911]MDD9382711.1 hypothetical protein [Streptomyces sp. ZAF1911]
MSFEQEWARQGPSTTPPGGSGVLGTTPPEKKKATTLTYLMARRVTDALGCENKPLEQAPAVKSGDTQ